MNIDEGIVEDDRSRREEDASVFFTMANLGSELSKRMGNTLNSKYPNLQKMDDVTVTEESTRDIYESLGMYTSVGKVGPGWVPIEGEDVHLRGNGIGDRPAINTPYQFNEHDDVRSNPYYPKLGRIFNNDIVSNYQYAVFEVGRLKYSNGLKEMLSGVGDDKHKQLKSYIRGDGKIKRGVMFVKSVIKFAVTLPFKPIAWLLDRKFVAFESDMPLFKNYVNEMMAEIAAMYGLGKSTANDDGSESNIENDRMDSPKSIQKGDTPLRGYGGTFDALSLINILPGERLYEKDYIPFLLSKGVSISESINNSTEQHPLAAQMNQESMEAEANNQVGMSSFGKDNLIGGVIDHFKTRGKAAFAKITTGESGYVLSGDGRISLPNVWSNSDFSRSYTIPMKFNTPYGNDVSQFEDVMIPFLIVLAMSSARQVGKMSYTSPFIIRVTSKNLFACPYGIVKSLNIKRGTGDKNDWKINNRPKTIELDMNIEDLSPNLVLSINCGRFASLHSYNVGMRSYMSVLGGLSISEKNSLAERFDDWMDYISLKLGSTFDPKNLAYSVSNSIVPKPITKLRKNYFNKSIY